jgi:hypothetical protein
MSVRAPLTVGDLVDALTRDEVAATDEVRLVFHGTTRKSFNMPALEARAGVNNDLIVVCFEKYGREDERPADSSSNGDEPMNGEPWTASRSRDNDR